MRYNSQLPLFVLFNLKDSKFTEVKERICISRITSEQFVMENYSKLHLIIEDKFMVNKSSRKLIHSIKKNIWTFQYQSNIELVSNEILDDLCSMHCVT